MKIIGACNNLLTLFQSFQDNRYQRVLLNGQTSHSELIKAGVSQGSSLGLLLFSIYTNDLPNNLISKVILFAHDTSIFSIVNDINPLSTSANQLICCANQLTGFYMRATLALNGLMFSLKKSIMI